MTDLLREHMARNDSVIQSQQLTLRKLKNQLGQLASILANRPLEPLLNSRADPTIKGNEQETMPQQFELVVDATTCFPSVMIDNYARILQRNATAGASWLPQDNLRCQPNTDCKHKTPVSNFKGS